MFQKPLLECLLIIFLKIEGIVEEYNVPIGEKFMSKLNSQKKFIETNREVIKDWLTRNNLDDSTHVCSYAFVIYFDQIF